MTSDSDESRATPFDEVDAEADVFVSVPRHSSEKVDIQIGPVTFRPTLGPGEWITISRTNGGQWITATKHQGEADIP